MRGLPTSWEKSAATIGFPSSIKTAVWSPCSKFIAVALGKFQYGGTIEILDAATLGKLTILPLYKQSITQCLIFSPDTSLLTWIGQGPDWIISWDVQTGVQVSAISIKLLANHQGHSSVVYSSYGTSATYAICGTMIGLHNYNASTSTISTYNILSGTHIHSHSVQRLKLQEIWAHGECLRYAVIKSKTINVWEVGFTSTCTLAEVESLSLPIDLPLTTLYFYPTFSRVAFFANGTGHIWDTTHSKSKYIMESAELVFLTKPSFSSDGCFFACDTRNSVLDIWKESPNGYTIHQRLTSISFEELCISPNGGLLLTWSASVAQLWDVTGPSAPNPTTSSHMPEKDKKSRFLVFSPDKVLAAVAQRRGMMVTILDLKSGVPRLTFDTGMEVYGLGVTENTIVILGYDDDIGSKKFVTWSIPTGGCVLNLKVNINDSIKTVTFDGQPMYKPLGVYASMSPDLHHIALMESNNSRSPPLGLHIYDVATGQHITSVNRHGFKGVWFTQDGSGVWWVGSSREEEGWKFIKGGGSNTAKLEHLGSTKCPPGELPWQCPPSYKVADGWILHSSGKRLLWLPPHWWPDWHNVVWGGQFLALLNRKSPELLIIELE